MSLETLHLVLFLWMGVCLMALVASFVCAFPRAVRASHAPVSVEVRTPGSRRIPQGVVPAPTRPAPDIKVGLRKSRVALVGRLERLLRGREQLDEETFAEIESILFSADLGVRTADDLLAGAREAASPEEVKSALEARALELLRALPPAEVEMVSRPHVILVAHRLAVKPPHRLRASTAGVFRHVHHRQARVHGEANGLCRLLDQEVLIPALGILPDRRGADEQAGLDGDAGLLGDADPASGLC